MTDSGQRMVLDPLRLGLSVCLRNILLLIYCPNV
jgi:hypothetical protein